MKSPNSLGSVVIGRLPANAQVTQALARVRTTFNAGTTNVLTAGTNPANYDNILGTADIAEGSVRRVRQVPRERQEVPAGDALPRHLGVAGEAVDHDLFGSFLIQEFKDPGPRLPDVDDERLGVFPRQRDVQT